MTYAAYTPQTFPTTNTLPPWQGRAPQGAAGTSTFPTPFPEPPFTEPPFPEPKRRKPVVLVVLLIAMVLAAGTFGTLYLTTRSDQQATANSLSAKEKELEKKSGELTEANNDRKAAESRAENAEQELDDAQGQLDSLEACRTASQDLLFLLSTANASDPTIQQQLTEAVSEMTLACL